MKQGKFGGPIDYFSTQTPQWKQKSLLRKQKPTILDKGKTAGDVITSCSEWIVMFSYTGREYGRVTIGRVVMFSYTGREYGRVTIGRVVTVAVEGTFCIPNFLTITFRLPRKRTKYKVIVKVIAKKGPLAIF